MRFHPQGKRPSEKCKRDFGCAASVFSDSFFYVLKTVRADIRKRVRRCATHPALKGRGRLKINIRRLFGI
ncbi:hypothetical protein [Kingella potus]|uniref:hypothetical protein n=1 Tax=Kingella potus TaxID=265175 RepID=UPI001FD46EA9|nr:hypothetical protein [Kingella potus]UOP01352.1 hypothetical protein LVJ84_03665 [Kingella potus]